MFHFLSMQWVILAVAREQCEALKEMVCRPEIVSIIYAAALTGAVDLQRTSLNLILSIF